MLFNLKHTNSAAGRLDLLAKRLRDAPAMSADLFSEITAGVCIRLPNLNRSGAAGKIDQLAAAGAWCDAALALIGIELPAWKLRRAVYDDGEWHCSLSRQPNLPIELDDAIEASHEVLALAILSALVEVRRREFAPGLTRDGELTVTAPTMTTGHAVCCDNFA